MGSYNQGLLEESRQIGDWSAFGQKKRLSLYVGDVGRLGSGLLAHSPLPSSRPSRDDSGFLLGPLPRSLPIYQIKATGSIESF